MAVPAASARRSAAALALLSAFLWASYYGFILGLHGRVSPLGLLAYPFLTGGVVYGLWAVHEGHGRTFLALFADPAQWGRIGMYWFAQVSVLLITLVAGAVDAALLSLVGDVALTPLLVMAVYGEGRERLGAPTFIGGVLLSGVGATLTILAGGAAQGLSGYALLVAPVEALCIAGYFVSTSRAARTLPMSALAGQSVLAAGLLSLPWTFVLPATTGSLDLSSGVDFALLLGCGATSFWVAPALYFLAIGRVGIILPALLMAAIPVFTVGFAAVFTGAFPTPLALLGVPIAVAGAILAIEGGTGAPAPAPPAPG